jgi:hypothetical protein
VSAFCPENEVTTVLIQLESDQYFYGRCNVDVYIAEFKDPVDMPGYMDPITVRTPAAVPTQVNIRVSALNKGGSSDPGTRSAVSHTT